jgi:ABC-type glycerol-3-phosphate transport system substrate-binding protein
MRLKLIAALFSLAIIIGCSEPKSDVSIFMMPSGGMSAVVVDELQKNLQQQVGETPTVSISSTPIFSLDKMIVEVAAGDHGIIVLTKDQWLGIARTGGMLPLDDLLKPADFPEGVVDLPVDNMNGKTENHLYAIPIANSKWMKSIGYKGEELFAFLHPRAPDLEKSKQVLVNLSQR